MFKKQHFASVLDVPDFVQLLTHALYDQAQCERAHPAWDRVEEFLSRAGSEIRDMLALEMLERFQNAGYPSGGDSFARFLGPEVQRLWAELQAIWKTSIMLDLQDRTVLEGEVLISRIVNHRAIQL
jgi:hypothetical protein